MSQQISDWERSAMRTMTREEWDRYKDSDQYINFKIVDAKTDKEAFRWIRVSLSRSAARNAEAWTEALEIAFSLADSEEDLPHEKRAEFIETLAENMMVSAEKYPPTWTSFVDCPLCGRMPCKPGREKDACPWDATEIGRVARESREQLTN